MSWTVRYQAGEVQAIREMAQARIHGKLGFDHTRHTQTGTLELNTFGLAGEIAWARFFGVPFYQNRSWAGDGHRPADLELRDRSWLEVKTTQHPTTGPVLYSSTGKEWSWVALGWAQKGAATSPSAWRG